MKKLKIILLLISGSFIPFLWGGMLLWWFFTRATKHLTWWKIYLTLIGSYALIMLPASSIIDYLFHTTIRHEYLWPGFEIFIGLSTLFLMVGGLFMRPVVYPDDYYYDDYKPKI